MDGGQFTMKRLYHVNNGIQKSFPVFNKHGITLVELLIAGTVTSLVLASLCGVYFSAESDWTRQSGEGEAVLATNQACSQIAAYAKEAVSVILVTRFSPNDAVAINLPQDVAYSGVFAPIYNNGNISYRSGQWIIFYLSDSTGNYNRAGDILWMAQMSWSNFPNSVVPNSGWSLYYDTGKGRITPLKSISFSITNSSNMPMLTINAVSSYNFRGNENQLSQSRTVCLRNVQ